MNDVALKNVDKPTEVWFQDSDDPQLWHGDHGVILNTAALNERSYYFDLLKVQPHEKAQVAFQSLML